MTTLSPFLLKASYYTLDTLFNTARADIRVHNTERIPDGPVLFVVNHFTRIETIFLPYIVKKYSGRVPLSLAHHSFFSGAFGSLMEKLGAISTKNEHRDRLLTGALLTNHTPVIIFPEGQMIKDKKIIEKGKFIVYNAGIRRPPHTGAARIALWSEIVRQRLRLLSEQGNDEARTAILEHFALTPEEGDEIIKQRTAIVPLNITYFPLRARNNAINGLVSRFMKDMNERFVEELEVEGTMLIDGVDIDINCGDPQYLDEMVSKDKKIRNYINSTEPVLDLHQINSRLPLKKHSLALMQEYMGAIYRMTTVNHDHIFASLASAMTRTRIPEWEFRARAYLIIQEMQRITLTSHHTALAKKQNFLLSGDSSHHLESFLRMAEERQLLRRENGMIVKEHRFFSGPTEFHTLRRDNPVEVLRNEVEPIRTLSKVLFQHRFLPPFLLKRKIRTLFIKKDLETYQRDRRRYQEKEHPHPDSVGRPFLLHRAFNTRGVVLIHGYMAAPEEVRPLAESLYRRGFSVYAPRLRGHGTAPEDLAERTWEEWYDSVNRGLIIMKHLVPHVSIAGFSTGAGLALLQAARKPHAFDSLISISAPLRLQNIASRFSSTVDVWNNFLKKVKVEKGRMEFISNTPENPDINYHRNPIHGIHQLGQLMDTVRKNIADITIPALIIQGSEDPVVNPKSADEVFQSLSSEQKELVRIHSKRHGIVRGDTLHGIADFCSAFLDRTMSEG